MGVYAIGEKPIACTPMARRKRLSVPAGKISRSTRKSVGVAFSSSTALLSADAFAVAVAAVAVAAVAPADGAGSPKSLRPIFVAVSSKMPKKGLVCRLVSVKKWEWSGAVQGAKVQLRPSALHHLSSIALNSAVARVGQMRTSKPASASVGITFSA